MNMMGLEEIGREDCDIGQLGGRKQYVRGVRKLWKTET